MTSAAIMTAPPSACSGVITSPRNRTLPMVASGGSRFMNSAVRNGPIRMVEANTPPMPVVTATLSRTSATQPDTDAGGCQFQVSSETTASTTVDEISEYQVICSASAPCSAARVTISITTRQPAAASAASTPMIASAVGCAPIMSASPRNAASAAAAPHQLIFSSPVAAATSPVTSG